MHVDCELVDLPIANIMVSYGQCALVGGIVGKTLTVDTPVKYLNERMPAPADATTAAVATPKAFIEKSIASS